MTSVRARSAHTLPPPAEQLQRLSRVACVVLGVFLALEIGTNLIELIAFPPRSTKVYYHTHLAAFVFGVIASITVVASGHRNAVALSGRPLRYSMTDLFVAFLVPPFNLVWPYRIVREIWDATSPVTAATHGPRELRSWLLAWIIAVVMLGIPGIGAVLAVPVIRAIGIPPVVYLGRLQPHDGVGHSVLARRRARADDTRARGMGDRERLGDQHRDAGAPRPLIQPRLQHEEPPS